MAQDAFEDALLMGCSEKQLREYFRDLMAGLETLIKKRLVLQSIQKGRLKAFSDGTFLISYSLIAA